MTATSHHAPMQEPDTGPNPSLPRLLGWGLAATFLLGTLLILLLNFNITAPAPAFHEGEDVLVDNILVDLTSQQQRWPQDLLANVLFAFGFASVAGLGATLPRWLGPDDDRRRLVAVTFILASALGIVGELAYLGIKEVSINAQYCECALRDPDSLGADRHAGVVEGPQGDLEPLTG